MSEERRVEPPMDAPETPGTEAGAGAGEAARGGEAGPGAGHGRRRTRRDGAASDRTEVRPGDRPSPDEPSFASLLCRRHHAWVVDRTDGDLLPRGWRELLGWVFEDLCRVVDGERRLALRRLAEERGELVLELLPLRAGSPTDDACARAIEMVVSHARAASRLTCEACGAPGVQRAPGRRPVCDAHARATDPTLAVPRVPGPCPEVGAARGTVTCEPGEVALYDLRDVTAALGPEDGGDDGRDTFLGDPEPLRGAEPDSARTAYLRRLLRAGEDARWRGLARPGRAHLDALAALALRAPHMRAVTHLVARHLGAAAAMGTHATFPPLLLVGEPGTGKTWIAERLAEALGLPVRRHPMNVASVGDALTGSHPVWRGARTGLVARTLLTEAVANPVVVLDEVDKAAAHDAGDPLRPLYSCLEPVSAAKLPDEFLGFPLDASHVCWLLTANSVDPLPRPILDRLVVLETPLPDQAQLRAVARGVFEDANGARRRFFRPPDDDVLDRLAAASPRRMRLAVVEAMARAASAGRRAVRPEDVVVESPASRRRVGFGAWP